MGARQVRELTDNKEIELYQLATKQTDLNYFLAFIQVHPELSSNIKVLYNGCLKEIDEDEQKCTSLNPNIFYYIPYIYLDLFKKRVLPQLVENLKRDTDSEFYDSLFRLFSFDNYDTVYGLLDNSKFRKIMTDPKTTSSVSSAIIQAMISEESLAKISFIIWLWNALLKSELLTADVLTKIISDKTEPMITYQIIPNLELSTSEQGLLYPIMANYWKTNYNQEDWLKLLTLYTNIKRCSLWTYIFKTNGLDFAYNFINEHSDLFCPEMWATIIHMTEDIHDRQTAVYLNAITISVSEMNEVLKVYREMFTSPDVDFELKDILKTYIRNTDNLAKYDVNK